MRVSRMLEYANIQLARTDKFVTKEYKIGIVTMIEKILHDTGNYAGFMFINNDDSECDTLGYYSRFYFYSQLTWLNPPQSVTTFTRSIT